MQTETEKNVVALIGATGNLGRYVLRDALARGMNTPSMKVRALARSPAKLNPSEHLTIIEGSVLDPSAVNRLVQGADVVVSCLGSRPKEKTVVEAGTRIIVDAIKAHKIKKYVHLSSIGVGDSVFSGGRTITRFLIACIGRKFWDDMEAAEKVALAAQEGCAVVIVRPTAFMNGKEKKGYQCRSISDPPGKLFLRRLDGAAFMLDAAVSEKYDGKIVHLFSA